MKLQANNFKRSTPSTDVQRLMKDCWFFGPDSQIVRELSTSPNSPSLLIPSTAPIPATLLYSAISSLESSYDPPLYINTVELHEQTISDQQLKIRCYPHRVQITRRVCKTQSPVNLHQAAQYTKRLRNAALPCTNTVNSGAIFR